jgi:hypothetical protein
MEPASALWNAELLHGMIAHRYDAKGHKYAFVDMRDLTSTSFKIVLYTNLYQYAGDKEKLQQVFPQLKKKADQIYQYLEQKRENQEQKKLVKQMMKKYGGGW